MAVSEHIAAEEQFINLLLFDKDCIRRWLSSPLALRYFDVTHELLLKGITWAYNEGVHLTRASYIAFIEDYLKTPSEKASQSSVYNRCSMRMTKVDDFPMLVGKIKDAYVRRMSAEYFRDFSKDRDKHGDLDANRNLATKLLSLEAESKETQISFVDIAGNREQFMKDLLDRRNNPASRLTCNIKEIDDTMSVGFQKGTLSLFCAGPGAFKCLSGKDLLQTDDGRQISVIDYFNKYRSSKKPKILSLDESNKVYYQDVVSIQSNGVRPCFYVNTKLGFNTIVTGNHPILTFNGYRQTDEILPNDYVAISRRSTFGDTFPSLGIPTWLGCIIADGGVSGGYCNFTNTDPAIINEFCSVTRILGGNVVPMSKIKDDGIRFRANGMRYVCEKYGIWGKLSIHKRIHSDVFSWNEPSIVKLLSAMYGCDGRISIRRAKKKDGIGDKMQAEVIYSTSSYGLAQDVRNLLLKFGLVAKLFKFMSKCGNHQRESYRVIISSGKDVAVFIRRIGFLGEKQKIAEAILPELDNRVDNPNVDVIPAQIWDTIYRKMKEQGKSHFDCQRKIMGNRWRRGTGGNCGHKGKPISRRVLKRIAEYLDNDTELLSIAESDIFWDKVQSVIPTGEEETFDIAMPNHHNFVCDNIITHNTTIMMNIALNIWENSNENVCFMPLEMPWQMMMQKIVSRQTRVPFQKIDRADQLTEDEIKRVAQQLEEMNSKTCRFKLLKLGERAKVSAIRAEIERRINYFQPRILVIDYFDNLLAERRAQREGLEHRDIFEDLIAMGEKYGFAVVTAAKLTRDALKRLREMKDSKAELDSTDVYGGQEFGAYAANVYGQIRNSAQPASLLDIFCMKTRYGSPIFATGRAKATLEIQPDYGLIQSQSELGPAMKDAANLAAAFDVADKLTGDANPDNDSPPF